MHAGAIRQLPDMESYSQIALQKSIQIERLFDVSLHANTKIQKACKQVHN